MDVIFYFVISLLIATVLCYLIFLIKNGMQREDIKKETVALQTVGTDQQNQYEKTVIDYQKKINDFSVLLKNHEFASNVFAFVQEETMPNIWFKQFSLDEKNAGVQLAGESDDIDAFSRQVANFEQSKYVKSIGALNSLLGESARANFSINLALDQSIFSFIANEPSILETTTSSNQLPISGPNGTPTPANQTTPANQANSLSPANNLPAEAATTANQPANAPQQAPLVKSSEKLITSFHLLLNPEVIGVVDETNYTVTLNVPYGTDVKNLMPSIIISPKATVLPASNVSQDFVNPVTYIITAEDGTTQNYSVKVITGAQPAVSNKKSSESGSVILIVAVVAGIIAVLLVIILLVWRKIRGAKPKI